MSVETMTEADRTIAAKAYIDWQQHVPQVGGTINQLDQMRLRGEALYQPIYDRCDASATAAYGADAVAFATPHIAGGVPKIIAFLRWVAGFSGVSYNAFLDSLKDPA